MLFSQILMEIKMSTVIYKDKNVELNMFKAWTVCIVSSLFFFYEFIQINLFNSINNDVIRDFHLNATQLGFLSACYFYSTVFFLLPAGQILDRFSAKKVILITLALCIVGIIGFALSKNVILAAFFRFIEGIGSAFCFLGSLILPRFNRHSFLLNYVLNDEVFYVRKEKKIY